jgi:hypothetical protein
MKPEITIHNAETGEIITREMTDAEHEVYLERQNEKLAMAEAEATKAAEKAALLAQLGITNDQAKLLLS